jgi:hypothetical protein
MLTNDIQLRDYLLGRLPETEAERLEEHLIESEEVFLTLRTLEDDLFDEFVRGEMDDAERDAFLQRYGRKHNRIAFARALAQKRADVVAFSPRPRWIGLAAAAALLFAFGTVLLVEDRRPRLSSRTVAIPAGQAGAPVLHSVTLTLTLGTSRSAGGAQVVKIPANASTLQLRVRLNPNDRFDRYRAGLASSTGATVWLGDDLHAITDAGELILPLTVPASSLSDGSYELAVHGGDEDLGFVELEVQRNQ